ncbi:MAG: hypothetical protein WC179_10065 [Candidatus Cloacimonadaceae bacterium]
MSIVDVKEMLQKNFIEMSKDSTHLFEVELDKDALWNLYLDSFPAGTNDIYRVCREHDCSACRQFIKRLGNIVVIKDNEVKTIWGFNTDDYEYGPVMKTLDAFVKSCSISSVFITKDKKFGIDKNFEQSETGIVTYEHFYIELPSRFQVSSSKSVEEIKGEFRATKEVFQRSLSEITKDSVLTVLELISSNMLYKGEEWKNALAAFLTYKRAYDALQTDTDRNNFALEQSIKAGIAIGRIRNHSIGVLLTDISEGMDLDEAVRRYEKIVAPENYKRPKAIFTKKMLEDAQKTIVELGYMDSLPRRYATLDDITVNDILFSNKDSSKRITGSVFDDMISDIAIEPKKFSKIEEITIDNFITNVLPTAQELEILFENKHAANMVSLIAPVNKDAPIMFKWNNPFSWAYSGNITDSSMKENVKSAGGNVEGVLRFSIQWNDSEYNPNDFDAHCIEPDKNEIYYGHKRNNITTGQLDVDVINPIKNQPAVENITWTDIRRMKTGSYKFFVNNYNHRGGTSGFTAEIEFDGQIYSFNYNKELRYKEDIYVAEVIFDGTKFTIVEKLPSNVSSKEMWNLKTNQFVPVSVVCYSPNYWSDNSVGHRHYIFALKDCINPEAPSAFFNEFLKPELIPHKRVFEALSGKMRVEDSDDQLSGLGFSSTKRNELIVKIKGSTERVMKVKF